MELNKVKRNVHYFCLEWKGLEGSEFNLKFKKMKQLLFFLRLSCLKAGLAISMVSLCLNMAYSQQVLHVYGNIDFNKVAPANENDYLTLEGKVWKPIQQQHINQGGLKGWFVFRVWFAGTGSEYNYAVMELYDNFAGMTFPYSDDIVSKVHPGMNQVEMMDKTLKARDIVRAQSVERIAMLRPGMNEFPYKYVTVYYLDVKPENTTAYEKMEQEVWMPLHKERIKAGLCNGWDLFKIVIPNGESVPYKYLSMEWFKDFGEVTAVDGLDPLPVIQKNFPEKPAQEVFTRSLELRTVYRKELWELVEFLKAD